MVYFHEIHLRRNKTMFISMKSEYVETNPRLFPRKLITTKQIRTYFHENQLRKNKHRLPHKHCEIRSKQLPPFTSQLIQNIPSLNLRQARPHQWTKH